MVKRAKLRAKLAAAIDFYILDPHDPVTLRKTMTKSDLVLFGIRRNTSITLADWAAAIELAKQPTLLNLDPEMTFRIAKLQEAIDYFSRRHQHADAEKARQNLAQLLELH